MVEATAATNQSLLGAYKFSDYQVEEWLSQLWSCKSNAEFKVVIEANVLAQELNEHYKESYEKHVGQQDQQNKDEN